MSARLTDIWVVGKSPTRGKRLPQTFAVSHALGFAKRLIPRLLTFLGLHIHDCRKTRKGGFGLGRKSIAKPVSCTLSRIKVELWRRMHHDIYGVARWLRQVIRGRSGHFVVPASFSFLISSKWFGWRFCVGIPKKTASAGLASFKLREPIGRLWWYCTHNPINGLPSRTWGMSRVRERAHTDSVQGRVEALYRTATPSKGSPSFFLINPETKL